MGSSHPQVSLASWSASQYDLEDATTITLFDSLSTSGFSFSFLTPQFYKWGSSFFRSKVTEET